MSSSDESRQRSTRRREVIGGLVAVVVTLALVVLGLVLRGSGEAGEETAAGSAPPATTSGSASPRTTAPQPATPEEPPPSGDADRLPPSLSPVAFDQAAVGGDGVTARIVSLEGVRGTAQGAGNIAGPALRVSVRLTNGTADPLDLGLVSVTLTHGQEDTPASPLDDPSRVPFGGMLAPGGTAEGVYYFSVPEGDREAITLTVGYRAGAPFLVFRGPAD